MLTWFLDKVQAEIDRVIGQTRQPTMADRPNLPYTDAVMHEIMRMGNIIPLNGLRLATEDMTLGGYFIPKVHSHFLKSLQDYPESLSNDKVLLFRVRPCCPYWALWCSTRLNGRLKTASTRDTSSTLRESLWREKLSCLSLLVNHLNLNLNMNLNFIPSF